MVGVQSEVEIDPVTSVLLIPGTYGWGWTDDAAQWWHPLSPFVSFLEQEGFAIIGADCPFVWSTELDGLPAWLRPPKRKHVVWESGGLNLYAYLANRLVPIEYVPIRDRNLIAHSHAMQIVAYACAHGLKVNRLLTVSSPVRADMREVYREARLNVAHWRHLYSDASDRIQWLGTLFDGKLGIVRRQEFADMNVRVPRVAHSQLLHESSGLLKVNGDLDWLKKGV